VPWPSPQTTAYGLRVPSPIGGFVCLQALRETKGTGITVSESAIADGTRDLARSTGIDVCPEGGAAWAALAPPAKATTANSVVTPIRRIVNKGCFPVMVSSPLLILMFVVRCAEPAKASIVV
jgi:hypothetical protein